MKYYSFQLCRELFIISLLLGIVLLSGNFNVKWLHEAWWDLIFDVMSFLFSRIIEYKMVSISCKSTVWGFVWAIGDFWSTFTGVAFALVNAECWSGISSILWSVSMGNGIWGNVWAWSWSKSNSRNSGNKG